VRRTKRRGASGLALPLALACCAAAPHEPRDLPATRADVADALRMQFELVLARGDRLRERGGPADEAERDELRRLANEIAERLVRVDPQSRARVLAARLESMR